MNAMKSSLIATALMAAAGIAGSAHAATATTTFQVRMIITESCDISTVTATDVDFGTRIRGATTPIDSQGQLVVNCSNGTPYNIGLSNGANPSSATVSASNRRMTGPGSATLAYGLFRDAGRTQLWGATIGTDTLSGTGNASNQSIPVYGRAISTDAPAGTYTDTVTATITY
ncbi:spore coat U domain-containing protein [Pseudoxanthomonas mexicana]|uniref:Csu type fimbrial protein n=1 Tax=Pseudoxanthomonas mexicana TaxID=128785 RepID=UPI00398B1A93